MKHNLKLAIFGLLFLSISILQAQPPITIDSTQTGRKMSQDTFTRSSYQTTTMSQRLSLNEAQRSRVNDLNMRYEQRYRVRVDSFRGNNRDKTTYQNRMMSLQREQDAELKSILTPDQWTNWEKWQAEDRKNWENQHKNDPDHRNHMNHDQPMNQNQKMDPTQPTSPTQPTTPSPDKSRSDKKKDMDKKNKTDMENKSSKPSQTSPPGGNGGQ